MVTKRERYGSYVIAGRPVTSCGPGCYRYAGHTVERARSADYWTVRRLGLAARSLGQLFDLIDAANA